MYTNMGMVERVLRVLAGVAIVIAGFEQVPIAWWGYLGLVPLTTGLVGYCPLYVAVDRARHAWRAHHPAPPRSV